MIKFLCDYQKKTQFFLFLSAYVFIVFPMEQSLEQPQKQFCAVPTLFKGVTSQNNYKIFDPKAAFDSNVPWRKVVPDSIKITPDEKSVVIAKSGGRVEYFSFGPSFAVPKELFVHSRVRCAPMIAVAHKKDGEQLIISAGNYLHPETQKRVSEYVILRLNQLPQIEKLNYPINTITLNSSGDMLAIANYDRTVIIDLVSGKSEIVPCSSKENWVTDVVFSADSENILFAEDHGMVRLGSITRMPHVINVSIDKQGITNDIIQKINYPTTENEILYLTPDGKTKIVDMNDLSHDLKKHVKTYTFTDQSLCGSVIMDQGSGFFTARWINYPPQITANGHCAIKVYRKKSGFLEEIMFSRPALEPYDYITECGQRRRGIGHLLCVAFRGNRLVALDTSGNMYLWTLPVDKDNEMTHYQKRLADYHMERRRSKSLSDERSPLVRPRSLDNSEQVSRHHSDTKEDARKTSRSKRVTASMPIAKIEIAKIEIDKKKRQSSPRIVTDVLRKNQGSKSSQGGSPVLSSPRQRDSITVKGLDIADIMARDAFNDVNR